MRRLLCTLLLALAIGACGPGDATEAPQGTATEASPAPQGRTIRGMRAIDRARDASALASERALRHDTIR
jgi:hypothetical protein